MAVVLVGDPVVETPGCRNCFDYGAVVGIIIIIVIIIIITIIMHYALCTVIIIISCVTTQTGMAV